MSYRDFATKYHNPLADAMMAYEGDVLRTKDIVKILLQKFPVQKFPDLHEKKAWLYPSDHCRNHTNKGACYCAETDNAIFMRLERGQFRVLKAKHLT